MRFALRWPEVFSDGGVDMKIDQLTQLVCKCTAFLIALTGLLKAIVSLVVLVG